MPAIDTSIETPVRRLIDEGFTAGNAAVADETVAPAMVEHQDFGPNHPAGPEGARRVIASLRRAFPDFALTIEDLAVDRDIVWTRNVATGTDLGGFMGHAPTGRSVRVDVIDVFRVADGRITEHWGVPDRLGALQQLGHVARPGAGRAAAAD
jgi:predicted ester cyclase